MYQKTTVLLYVGRLAKEKNVEELLEYQQKVQESGTILMIVGGGPYLETLRKKAAELGVTESVIFTGMVSPAEVASYYPAGDLFVRPRDLPMRKHWQQDCRYCVERMNVCGRLWKRAKMAGSTGPKRNS